MKHLRKYNESTESTDNVLDFYTLEEIFLPLCDILDVDMSRIKHDDGKFIYSNNPIYINFGELKVPAFSFETSAENYDRFKRSINTKISNIDNKIGQLNTIKDKLNILKDKIDSELPDIIYRLQQYRHFDGIKFGSTPTSVVIIVYLKDWDNYDQSWGTFN